MTRTKINAQIHPTLSAIISISDLAEKTLEPRCGELFYAQGKRDQERCPFFWGPIQTEVTSFVITYITLTMAHTQHITRNLGAAVRRANVGRSDSFDSISILIRDGVLPALGI